MYVYIGSQIHVAILKVKIRANVVLLHMVIVIMTMNQMMNKQMIILVVRNS